MIQMAGANFIGRSRQHLHRPDDSFREVQAHPGGADQNHQRQHQEERQIDAGQWLPQHAELLVVFVRLRHPARPRRELGGDVVAGDDDPLRPALGRRPHGHRAANHVAAVGQRLDDRRRRLPRGDTRDEALGGGLPGRARQCAGTDVDDRNEDRSLCGPRRLDAEHLDEADAFLQNVGLDDLTDSPDW